MIISGLWWGVNGGVSSEKWSYVSLGDDEIQWGDRVQSGPLPFPVKQAAGTSQVAFFDI